MLQRKCREIESQLQPLQEEFENKIESKAKLRSAMLAYAGLGLLVAQFAFFVRYWESPPKYCFCVPFTTCGTLMPCACAGLCTGIYHGMWWSP